MSSEKVSHRQVIRALALCLAMSATLSAQHRGHFGAARGSSWGFTPQHSFTFFGPPIQPLYYNQLDYGYPYYSSPYGSFYPSYSLPYGSYGYSAPDPGNGERHPILILSGAETPLEKRIVYVPTYLRPDPGPPLGDIARAWREQRANHKP